MNRGGVQSFGVEWREDFGGLKFSSAGVQFIKERVECVNEFGHVNVHKTQHASMS